MNEKWALILGDTERNEMSRIVKADDDEFTIGYLIRECRNKGQQAEDDQRAKLVAAAPDLLVACEEAFEEFSKNKYGSGGCPQLSKLHAAIAKAKGA